MAQGHTRGKRVLVHIHTRDFDCGGFRRLLSSCICAHRGGMRASRVLAPGPETWPRELIRLTRSSGYLQH
eukprot:9057767-Pyramimonas_sp.AAC.2